MPVATLNLNNNISYLEIDRVSRKNDLPFICNTISIEPFRYGIFNLANEFLSVGKLRYQFLGLLRLAFVPSIPFVIAIITTECMLSICAGFKALDLLATILTLDPFRCADSACVAGGHVGNCTTATRTNDERFSAMFANFLLPFVHLLAAHQVGLPAALFGTKPILAICRNE